VLSVAAVARAAQGPTFIARYSIPNCNPADVAVSPDGRVAVLRAFTPSSQTPRDRHFMTFFDPVSGTTLNLNACDDQPFFYSYGLLGPNDGQFFDKGYTHSDLVAINNARAVVIGSGDRDSDFQDETHVYFVDIGQTPPAPTCVMQHVFESGTEGYHGRAHDVAITPNGLWAVVNEGEFLHVFELRTGILRLTRKHAGVLENAVDSVEVTDDRAVVCYSKSVGFGIADVIVDIIDLTNPSGPQKLVGYQDNVSAPLGQGSTALFQPHDLSITPDGSAVVVAMGRATTGASPGGGVAALRLSDGAYLGGVFDGCQRNYPSFFTSGTTKVAHGQADSVEATDATAVSIGFTKNTSGTRIWRIEVFEVNPFGTPGFTSLAAFTDTATPGNEPHDLAITRDISADTLGKALVSSDFELMVVHDLASPAGSLELVPTAMTVTSEHNTFPKTRVSDSAFFMPPPLSLPPDAYNGVVSGRILGTTLKDFSNLFYFPRSAASAAASGANVAVGDTSGVDHTRTADLELVRATRALALRGSAPPDEPLPQNGGRDYLQFQIDNVTVDPASFTYALQAQFGGSGTTYGAVDSVVTGAEWVASVGETLLESAVPPNNPVRAFIHLMRAQ
jgi:hypothetical protein